MNFHTRSKFQNNGESLLSNSYSIVNEAVVSYLLSRAYNIWKVNFFWKGLSLLCEVSNCIARLWIWKILEL